MKTLTTISLLINIIVLLPVCIGIITDADWTQASYGPQSPSRSILLSVYMAIGLLSALLLCFQDVSFIAALLFVQVLYKATTPFTVGTLENPVVISNLIIAAFHTVTLFSIWRKVV